MTSVLYQGRSRMPQPASQAGEGNSVAATRREGYNTSAGGFSMPTTVYFATNRVVNGAPDSVASYTFDIVAPTRPQDVTYGTAFVESAGLTADTVGAIRSIQDLNTGGFSQRAIDDLSTGGRNILVFLHGFANSFEN